MAEALGPLDATFDVVVSSLMIHHLPGELRPKALAEMFRVLRPDGRILVADFRPPSIALARRLIRRVISPAMEHNPVHLLESMARDAGFEKLAVGEVKPWIHYVSGAKPA